MAKPPIFRQPEPVAHVSPAVRQPGVSPVDVAFWLHSNEMMIEAADAIWKAQVYGALVDTERLTREPARWYVFCIQGGAVQGIDQGQCVTTEMAHAAAEAVLRKSIEAAEAAKAVQQ